MIAALADLAVSDVAQGWPGGWAYAGRQLAHVVMGSVIAAFAALWWPLGAVLWLGWLTKELAGDMARSGFAAWVVADSAADLFCGALCFVIVRRCKLGPPPN